ncbi:MAG: protein kinase [Planctomycetota bacterium]|nr:protein kinase [Planctomycetota bacterium]
MFSHPRYEILGQIAVGDFATVFRARDKELNREVAIKQIHPQFLADQRQLERYWQEAQLLASLEHPNIMTIYDIDRSRGWLILELMNGSLGDMAAGEPVDLDFLRVALVCSLQALKFLHQNEVIHGDVKPTNLMVDRRNWVKLGDFGLAQRASDDQGSLLKGTTKYIAPERVSDQFGPVGPAADIYSLGFSMYELMCGQQFDSLFPGLNAFGRDQQIAWIMWHAAADRPAPEISRVLDGVPDDLAGVIQRMIEKDPARRYASADAVLADVKAGMGYAAKGPTEQELAAAAEAEEVAQRRRRRKRLWAAAAASILLSLAMLFWPQAQPPKPVSKLSATEGVIKHIYPGDPNRFVLDNLRTIKLRPVDQLYLNDQTAEFAALQKDDRVKVSVHEDEATQPFQEIRVTRPRMDRGEIVSVQPSRGTFVMQYTTDDGKTDQRVLLVPDSVSLRFNGANKFRGGPFQAGDLRKGDRVTVRHDAQDDQRVVLELSVVRVIRTRGTAQGVDKDTNQLTLVNEDGGQRVSLELSGRCEVVINGRQFVRNKPLQPSDIRQGDQVEVFHDTHVVKIVAERLVTYNGTLSKLVTSRRALEISLDGDQQQKMFAVDPQCQIRLGDDQVDLEALRTQDRLTIRCDAADLARPLALKIDAKRPVRRQQWAVIIAVQDYDDASLSPVTHLREDARRVQQVLIDRYAVAADQILMLEDPSAASLRSQLANFLQRIGNNAKLMVYVASHAYVDGEGVPYLAPRDFQLLRIARSGVPLTWLTGQIDASAAAEKVILLDTCHAGSGADLRRQPSSAEQAAFLNAKPQAAALTSATVITSCQEGQRAEVDGQRGRFSETLVSALSGAADKNGDHHVSIDELHAHLNDGLRAKTEGRQAPGKLVPRAAKGSRLSEEAVAALRQLSVLLGEEPLDLAVAQALVATVQQAAPDEPEAGLLMGLLQLKARKPDEALKTFLAVRRQHPDQLLPLEGMIWGLCQQKQYRRAVSGLVRIVVKLPQQVAADGELKGDAGRILPWVGRIREFAGDAPSARDRPAASELEKIDQAVAARGSAALRNYEQGRQHVRKQLQAIDKKIDAALSKAERLRLQRFERPKLSNYVSFSEEAAAQRVLDGIEE